LIGFGVSGAVFHAPLIASAVGMRLDAIVTHDPARIEMAKRAFPEATILPDVEMLWRQKSAFDLVVIATPNESHAALAERALIERLPVLVDKPLSFSPESGERLVALSKSIAVPLCVFQNRRWDSDFRTLLKVRDLGLVGVPFHVESRFELYRPLNTLAWRESATREAGGGVLFDLGSHLIDQVVLMFGRPQLVYGEMRNRRPGAVVDDDTFVSLTFANGVTSHIWLSKASRAMGPRFRMIGSEAVFSISDMDPQWDALQRGERPGAKSWGRHPSSGLLTTGDGSTTQETIVEPEQGAYQEFYQMLGDAIRNGGPMPVDASDAVDVLRIIEAARRSAVTSQAIRLESSSGAA
jgi:predicted dehydrogenase